MVASGGGPFGPAERPMTGYVSLPADIAAGQARRLAARSLEYVGALPAKKPKNPKRLRPASNSRCSPRQPTRPRASRWQDDVNCEARPAAGWHRLAGPGRGGYPAWGAAITPSWVSIEYMSRPPQRSWNDYLGLDPAAAATTAGWAIKNLTAPTQPQGSTNPAPRAPTSQSGSPRHNKHIHRPGRADQAGRRALSFDLLLRSP